MIEPGRGPVVPPDYGLVAFDALDSTMNEARRRAEAGERGPLWIFARRQTAGRGRRGRAWRSGQGNLLCTLLIRPAPSPTESARLSFLTAVALADALAPLCGGLSVALKWPNDVLLNGRKVAGILLESESGGERGVAWLAIGIGLNLAEHPADAAIPATSLAGEGLPVPSPESMLGVLSKSMAHWLSRWGSAGFPPIRDAWLRRAARLGEHIRVRMGEAEIEGVFATLDDEGRLVLNCADGVRRISAGDVFFPAYS